MKKIITVLIFLSIVILYNSSFAYTSKQKPSDNRLKSLQETIVALDITQKKSDIELRKIKDKQNSRSSNEIDEYSVFIEYLSHQINTYCLEIISDYGIEAIKNLPCSFYSQDNNSTAYQYKTINNDIQTNEEKIASLDNEFLHSLGDFDEMLLKEDEKLAAKTRNSSQRSGNNSNSANSQSMSSSVSQDQESEQNQETENHQGSQKNKDNNKWSEEQAKGKGSQKKSSEQENMRRRKLDEINDDIVARQLKEAAEKESDPELKEKLWDEYYKYKQNIAK